MSSYENKHYSKCKTAEELNRFTREERATCCWNGVKKSGTFFSSKDGIAEGNFFTQTREKTVRNKLED